MLLCAVMISLVLGQKFIMKSTLVEERRMQVNVTNTSEYISYLIANVTKSYFSYAMLTRSVQ